MAILRFGCSLLGCYMQINYLIFHYIMIMWRMVTNVTISKTEIFTLLKPL